MKNIKLALAIILMLSLSINTFGAQVSDNDGSAFITKAEFDSLKNNFQSQIDQYNQSIDSKIDGAIAAYLANLKINTIKNMDNLFGKMLADNGNMAFNNLKGEASHFGNRQQIKYNGNAFWACTYAKIWWRARENFSFEALRTTLNANYGDEKAIYMIYDEDSDGNKVFNKLLYGTKIDYTSVAYKYFSGDDLAYGGVINNIACADNTLAIWDPGTLQENKNWTKYQYKTTGLWFTNNENNTNDYNGITYTNIKNKWFPYIGNTQYTSRPANWTAYHPQTYVNNNKVSSTVYESAFWNCSYTATCSNIPFTGNGSTLNAPYSIKSNVDLAKKDNYTTKVLTLKNTRKIEGGGGPLINAALGWYDQQAQHTQFTGTYNTTLYEITADTVALNNCYNKYLYDNFGLKKACNYLGFPLMSYTDDEVGKMSFTIKPKTTNGVFCLYSNPKGTQTTNIIPYKINDATTTTTSKTLNKNTEYTITANINPNVNIYFYWEPSTDVPYGNSFETSNAITVEVVN